MTKVYVQERKESDCDALVSIAEDFKDKDLGLYALDIKLESCPDNGNQVLADLLAKLPNSRLGARIVDLLSARAPELVSPPQMSARFPNTLATVQATLLAAERLAESGEPAEALRLAVDAVSALPAEVNFPVAKWAGVIAPLSVQCGLTTLEPLATDLGSMNSDEARQAAAFLALVLLPLKDASVNTLWAERADSEAMLQVLATPSDANVVFAAVQALGNGVRDERSDVLETATRFIKDYCAQDTLDAASALHLAATARTFLQQRFEATTGGEFSRAVREASDEMSACTIQCAKRVASKAPAALALRSFLERHVKRFGDEYRFLPEDECLRLLLSGFPKDAAVPQWLAQLSKMESDVWRNHGEAAALERQLWVEHLEPKEQSAAILKEVSFLYMGEKYPEARALSQRLLVAADDKVRDPARVYEILCEMRMGDLERTKVLADKFLDTRAGSAWATHVRLLRAYVLMMIGRYPQALADCQILQSAGLDPERQRKVREMLADLAAMAEQKSAQVAAPAASASMPNVVMISLDTTRADHLGCYGDDKARTPNIDKLAAAGTVFEHAYTTASWTKPAHASLMTGRYPLAHGAQGHDDMIAPKAGMLAEWLKAAGYTTAATVSAPPLNSIFGFGRGFDSYDDYTYEFDRVCNLFLRGNDGPIKIHLGATSPLITYTAIMTFNRIIPRNTPFFYFVNYFDAHHNYQPVYPWNAETRKHYYGNDWGMIDQWNSGPQPFDPTTAKVDSQRLISLYDDEIAALDYEVGEWVYHAQATKSFDKTIFVILGDHGEEFLEHGNLAHGHGLYEEVLHVPLIICGPGVPKGKRIGSAVSLVDVAPTLMELLGQPVPAGLDGESLVPLLRGEVSSQPRTIFASLNLQEFQGYAVILGNQKLIANTRSGRFTLSDLANDPQETIDIGPQQPAHMKQLVELVAHMQDAQRQTGLALDAGGVVNGESLPSLDALMEQFRAMGYIGK